MIDLLGVLLGAAFLLALAVVASTILAGLTWLLLRKRRTVLQVFLTAIAFCIPILSAAYMWLCVALLPGESLFGDIAEPLPNGYEVKAFGKMPDFASISDPKNPRRSPRLSQDIGKIAVVGPLVVGQYSHPFDSFTPNPNEPYFLFNTIDGTSTDFPTFEALQSKLEQSPNLSEVQYFRSPLAATRRKIYAAVELGPPTLSTLLLFALVWRARRRIDLSGRDIYT